MPRGKGSSTHQQGLRAPCFSGCAAPSAWEQLGGRSSLMDDNLTLQSFVAVQVTPCRRFDRAPGRVWAVCSLQHWSCCWLLLFSEDTSRRSWCACVCFCLSGARSTEMFAAVELSPSSAACRQRARCLGCVCGSVAGKGLPPASTRDPQAGMTWPPPGLYRTKARSMPPPQDAVFLITILEPLFWPFPKQLRLGEDLTSKPFQFNLEFEFFVSPELQFSAPACSPPDQHIRDLACTPHKEPQPRRFN